ncbi:MAG: LPS export ABC transporter periplasmic protein LptC [Desulfocapsaceae bacterium]|nr:LPS export ABC transporter periplasmic protein LptC [Desulfocapsaceae bacterium]
MISGRNAIWIIPVALFLTFPLWKKPVGSFLKPRGDFSSSPPGQKAEGYNFAMAGITILQSEEDQKTATIRANRASSTEIPNEYILEQVDADILDEQGNITNILADAGAYNVDQKRLKLMDNVVITSKADNYTMKTDLLFYEGEKRIVYCPEETLLQGEGIVITGSSLHHDMNTGMYTLGGRVRCTLEGRVGS